MIAVTAPTGNIGSQLLPHLLAAGERVRVVARNPAKLPDMVRNQVEVVEGSTDDPVVLGTLLDGAQALFWLVPSPYDAPDIAEHYLRFTGPAAAVIKAHGVARVVAVSSLYHGLGRETGPGLGVRAMDRAITDTGAHYRALRNANFMENLLRQVAPLRQGIFALPVRPDVRMPIAATRDIAAAAARLLLDASWTGQGGVGVMGPEDLSHDDLAGILTGVLGHPVRFEQTADETFIATMVKRGASREVAQWLLDMFAQGGEHPHGGIPRTPEIMTPTRFWDWSTEVLISTLAISGWVACGFGEPIEEHARDCCGVLGMRRC